MILDILALVAAYLFGAIPFGLVLTKAAGLGDIRTIGSGNIGATNVLRTGRKDLALLTLLLDSGKGAIAVLLVAFYGTNIPDGGLLSPVALSAAAGAAAFLGHCFPLYLGFKGGKGVATFFGTILAINPLIALIAGLTWLGVVGLSRMSSAGGLSASIAAPIAGYFYAPFETLPFFLVMTALIFWRHKENISRILKGTEPKIGAKKD